LHRLGIEPASDGAAGFGALHQAGVGQHVEMLHDRRERHGERLRQRADRKVRLLGEARQQGPARRVGKRGKDAIERGGTKLNHVVKYKAATRAVKRPPFGPEPTKANFVRRGAPASGVVQMQAFALTGYRSKITLA
jgi:hypothetical protein